MMYRKIFVLTAVLCIIFWLTGKIESRIVFTYDESTDPFKWFLIVNKPAEIGSYVLVKGKEENVHTKGKLLTKKVLCAYPYFLKKDGMKYYCCDNKTCTFLHRAFRKTPKGTVLVPFNPCGGDPYTSKCIKQIPKEYYYLGTHSPVGYDSRYLGYFKKEEIKATLVPLL